MPRLSFLAPQVLPALANLRHGSRKPTANPPPICRGIQPALRIGIMTAFLILLAIVAAGVVTELVAANRAPFGYQDELGFHFGSDQSETPGVFELQNPS